MYTMLDELRRIKEEMDLFDQSLLTQPKLYLDRNSAKDSEITDIKMNLEESRVLEDGHEIFAEMEIPGVDKKDIQINITEDSIEVQAEANNKTEEKSKGAYSVESNYKRFYQSFPLPKNADPSNATGEYKNGILTIKVPKLRIEQKKRKLLEIR